MDMGIKGTQISNTRLALRFTKDKIKKRVRGARRL